MEKTAQQVGVRDLLEAGVHFGHQAKRWNPKMKRYIFAQRAGVHIIDLDQTLTLLSTARNFIRGVAEAGREVLFVGTKKQAQLTIAEQAMRSGQPYVAERYIGGMLTNFKTIQPRIHYFTTLAERVEETPEEERTGRDWFALEREYQKLRRNFAGITQMERLPGAVFVVDPKREELMVREANRLRIPVVALTDTNCDPEVVDYVIPGNDDAIRSINLISRLIADSILEGSGQDEVPVEDRPVPPVIEEARVAEEESLSDAAEAAEVTEITGPDGDGPEPIPSEASVDEESTNGTAGEQPVEEQPESPETVEAQAEQPPETAGTNGAGQTDSETTEDAGAEDVDASEELADEASNDETEES